MISYQQIKSELDQWSKNLKLTGQQQVSDFAAQAQGLLSDAEVALSNAMPDIVQDENVFYENGVLYYTDVDGEAQSVLWPESLQSQLSGQRFVTLSQSLKTSTIEEMIQDGTMMVEEAALFQHLVECQYVADQLRVISAVADDESAAAAYNYLSQYQAPDSLRFAFEKVVRYAGSIPDKLAKYVQELVYGQQGFGQSLVDLSSWDGTTNVPLTYTAWIGFQTKNALITVNDIIKSSFGILTPLLAIVLKTANWIVKFFTPPDKAQVVNFGGVARCAISQTPFYSISLSRDYWSSMMTGLSAGTNSSQFVRIPTWSQLVSHLVGQPNKVCFVSTDTMVFSFSYDSETDDIVATASMYLNQTGAKGLSHHRVDWIPSVSIDANGVTVWSGNSYVKALLAISGQYPSPTAEDTLDSLSRALLQSEVELGMLGMLAMQVSGQYASVLNPDTFAMNDTVVDLSSELFACLSRAGGFLVEGSHFVTSPLRSGHPIQPTASVPYASDALYKLCYYQDTSALTPTPGDLAVLTYGTSLSSVNPLNNPAQWVLGDAGSIFAIVASMIPGLQSFIPAKYWNNSVQLTALTSSNVTGLSHAAVASTTDFTIYSPAEMYAPYANYTYKLFGTAATIAAVAVLVKFGALSKMGPFMSSFFKGVSTSLGRNIVKAAFAGSGPNDSYDSDLRTIIRLIGG